MRQANRHAHFALRLLGYEVFHTTKAAGRKEHRNPNYRWKIVKPGTLLFICRRSPVIALKAVESVHPGWIT
jgi:hypothetical protein